MKRKPRNKPKRAAAPLKRVPKGDHIKTTKGPKVARAKAPKKPPLNLDAQEWRATITIYRANELTDTQRYALVNWMRAKANDLGQDDFGHNLSPTYRMRIIL